MIPALEKAPVRKLPSLLEVLKMFIPYFIIELKLKDLHEMKLLL